MILDLVSPEAFEWRRFWRTHIEDAEERGTVISPVWGGRSTGDVARALLFRSVELKSRSIESRSTPERLEDASLTEVSEPVVSAVELDEAAVRTSPHEMRQRSLPLDREARMPDLEQEAMMADPSMEAVASYDVQCPQISTRDVEKASSVAETPDLLRRVLTAGRLVYVSSPGTPPIVRAESSVSAVTTLLEDARSFCLVGPQGTGKMTVLNAALARSGIRHVGARAEEASPKPLLSLLPNQLTRGVEAKKPLQDVTPMVPRLAGLGYRYVVLYDLHHLPLEHAQELVRACSGMDSLKIAATSAQDLSLDGVEMLRRAYSVHDLRWIAFTLALQAGLILEQEAEAHLAGYAAKRDQADTVAEIVRRLQGGSLEDLKGTIRLFECEHRSIG